MLAILLTSAATTHSVEFHHEAIALENALVGAGASFLQGAARHGDEGSSWTTDEVSASAAKASAGGGGRTRDRLSAGIEDTSSFSSDTPVPPPPPLPSTPATPSSPVPPPPSLRGDEDGAGGSARGIESGSGGGEAGATIPQTPGMPVEVVPTRYVIGCGGDEAMAATRWRKTHSWRSEVSSQPESHI